MEKNIIFKDRSLEIHNQEDLERILKEEGFNLYVNYHTTYTELFDKYPILKSFTGITEMITGGFLSRESYIFEDFKSDLINDYLGYPFVKYNERLSSYLINVLFNVLNTRGEI